MTPICLEAPSPEVLQHWPGVFFRQRADLSFVSVSPTIEMLTGYTAEQWLGDPALFPKVVHELDAEEFARQIQRAAETPEGLESQLRFRHSVTGRVAYLIEYRRALPATDGQPGGFEGYWIDVTRQTLSERRLATSAWKETLGLITLGLAHDFNNVLAGTLALSESFLAQIPADHAFREGLELIRQNTGQAAQLVRRIAQLHRGKVGNPAYQNLNEMVADTLDVLAKVIPRRVELQTHPAAEPLPVYVDPVEAQQVLINLALNAADAIPERGTVEISTSLHATLPRLAHVVGTLPRTPAICLSVRDTGTGITARHLKFIFDPFFTTKPMNKGSGLGLYNARLFAEKHAGAISVESTPGAGTTFQVWLPQADFTEAERDRSSFNSRRRSVLLAGSPGPQLTSTADYLRQHNFHVVVGGLAAEDVLRTSDYRFDALLIVAEPRETDCLRLSAFVRQQRMPLKVIIKTVGCNDDELDTQYLVKADLIISSDVPQDAIVEKLLGVLDTAPPS